MVKHFARETVSRLKELIQAPPIHPLPDKTLLCSRNKNFLKEMYRNIQTGITKWCSANIFSDPRQKHLCWKYVKSERFLAVLRLHIVFDVK